MPRFALPVLLAALVATPLLDATVGHAQAPVFEPPVALNEQLAGNDGTDDVAAAVTNGTGTWVVAWGSGNTLQGTIDRDDDILFARSTDGGLSFTDSAALNTNATHDTEYFGTVVSGAHDNRPSLAAHGDRFIVVWHKWSKFIDYVVLARSDDAGATWTDPAVLFDASLEPSIATDGAGTWVLVWRRGSNAFGDTEIYVTRSIDDGTTWSTPAPLDPHAATESLTDVAPRVVWSHGVWVVAWTAVVPPQSGQSQAIYTRSTDGGATWSATGPLDGVNGLSSQAPDLASDGSGHWVAIWSVASAGENDLWFAQSSDDALTWSAPAALNDDAATDDRNDLGARVAVGASGAYTVVWTRYGSASSPSANHSDAMTASSVDGGATWSSPAPLNPSAAAAGASGVLDDDAVVTADPRGHLLAFWISNDRAITGDPYGDDRDVVMALAGHPCGNGVLDSGEDCDDGDRQARDCCGRTCGYDVAGTACTPDADLCTVESCDGAGTCAHANAPAGTPCVADGDPCTFDRCDAAAVCQHVAEPRPTCRVPIKPASSSLKIQGGDPEKRAIKWSWKHGPATTASELAIGLDGGASYALCVYDGAGLIVRGDMPAGGTCGSHGQLCWSTANKGLTYADRDRTPNGVFKAFIGAGAAGKVKMAVRARGAMVEMPSLPSASLPVRAQLVSEDKNICFDATYSAAGIKSNSAVEFRATSE